LGGPLRGVGAGVGYENAESCGEYRTASKSAANVEPHQKGFFDYLRIWQMSSVYVVLSDAVISLVHFYPILFLNGHLSVVTQMPISSLSRLILLCLIQNRFFNELGKP